MTLQEIQANLKVNFIRILTAHELRKLRMDNIPCGNLQNRQTDLKYGGTHCSDIT